MILKLKCVMKCKRLKIVDKQHFVIAELLSSNNVKALKRKQYILQVEMRVERRFRTRSTPAVTEKSKPRQHKPLFSQSASLFSERAFLKAARSTLTPIAQNKKNRAHIKSEIYRATEKRVKGRAYLVFWPKTCADIEAKPAASAGRPGLLSRSQRAA